ncbi:hypothetical protein N7519_008615 [Penicillium mononematosum]|uniref:uncharacterized protein n=1 Tax=Penicillium mononematosum TaxID=268346 RepID=UPI0025467025|nr:uncharacterized protein N7519_008615 [Penicillium mononematosum]KAJ6178154.1 hypothetical protein N7519_008615 [Penicillium mononematosum]
MSNQTLLQYLSIALPAVPVQRTAPSRKTTNPRYDVSWPNFNYTTIVQRYGGILNSKQIVSDPFPSPPAAIRDKPHFLWRFGDLLQPRVRRALRAGFEELAPQLQQLNLVPVSFDTGSSAAYIKQFRPDTAFFSLGDTFANTKNRAPGVLNVSSRWHSDYQYSEDPTLQDEYKQVLSEVNCHMSYHNARHGFILTNAELVVVRRLDENGRLAVSRSIPWGAGGPGELTVLMGLWYLGMLASEEDNWALV